MHNLIAMHPANVRDNKLFLSPASMTNVQGSQIKVFNTGGGGTHTAFVHRRHQSQHKWKFLAVALKCTKKAVPRLQH